MALAGLEPRLHIEGIVPLLDDHHLAVLADDPWTRAAFESELAASLATLTDTEVVRIDGGRAADLAGFLDELAGGLGTDRATAGPEGVAAVAGLLRRAAEGPKRRYLVWSDADVMLEADVALFGRLANLLFAVAAEAEHLSPDVLVLQRVIFTGGAKLGAFAEFTGGPFCRWLDDADPPAGPAVAACVDRPAVLAYRLEG
ncbi:MAG: hypothetical protein ACYTG1_00530 [Planctomycetota bacterium]|jgi:hypothetical protein